MKFLFLLQFITLHRCLPQFCWSGLEKHFCTVDMESWLWKLEIQNDTKL